MVKRGARRATKNQRPAQRQRAPLRRQRAPRANASRMTPAQCRALALSSPCAFSAAVDAGRAVLQHARDSSTSPNTTVQLIKGVAQYQCDANGNAALLIAPLLQGGIERFGATVAADTFDNLPGAAAASGVAARYRTISMEVDYKCMASYMNNAGSLYLGSLDPGMGYTDYRSQGAADLATRVANLRNIIDDRPKGSYTAQAAKDDAKLVLARQDAISVLSPSGGGAAIPTVCNGDAFIFPTMAAGNILFGSVAPITIDVRNQDLCPVAALAITGATASMPYQIEVCLLVEIVPASTVMSTTPGGAAGVAGFAGITGKIASTFTVAGIERAESVGERILEGGLTVAGYAGVPGASAGAAALHAGQSALVSFEHSRVGKALHLA